MADDGYTTILRTNDPTQGELVAEMLRREGIEARFHQVRSTLVGMAGNLIEMTVDVPAKAEAAAREVLADLEYVGAAEAVDDEAMGDAGGPLRSRRHPLLAAGFALLLPGGGHLYARRPWTALVLALGVVGALTIAMTARGTLVFEFAFAIWIAIAACDAVGGVRAARAESDGERPARGPQLLGGIGLLAAALVLGGGLRVATAGPRIARMWQLAKFKLSCDDGTITIENRDGRAHVVEISKIQIRARRVFEPTRLYGAGPAGASRLNLAAGGRGTMTVEVSRWLADICGFSRAAIAAPATPGLFVRDYFESQAPMQCGFVFDVSVVKDDGAAFDAYGTCMPSYEGTAELQVRR